MGIKNDSNKQTLEPKKRLMKMRSVRVPTLERSRSSLKKKKFGLSQKMILNDEMSKEDPNYMKATSCSYSKRGYTTLGDGSIEIQSAKAVKRLSSLKRSSKNSTARSRLFSPIPEVEITMFVQPDGDETMTSPLRNNTEIIGDIGRGAGTSIHVTRSGSIKLNTRNGIRVTRRQWSKSRFNQATIFRTDDEAPGEEVSDEEMITDLQANGMEGTSSFYARKPARALWKMPSMKNRRLLIKKQSRSHEVRKGQFDHSTCSSTINSAKFLQLDIDTGRHERYSTMQVCKYKYCSVHGNLHASSPAILASSRKYSLKKQNSRRRNNKSMIEKDQMQDITMEDQAGPSISEAKNENVLEASTSTNILLNKQTSSMWNMIYSHCLMQENEKKKEEEDQFTGVAENGEPEFNQAEAVDFVQQAVDGILFQDETPRELNDENQMNEGEIRRGKENSTVMKSPNQKRSRGFQIIGKMIATRRFIKTVEKLRKMTSYGKETALLRHISMDKRKGAEENMLDFALQQVITKLDPARQRKVAMLVEAFERVTHDNAKDDFNCHDAVATVYTENRVNEEPAENVQETVIEEDEEGSESKCATDDGGAKSRGLLIGDPHNSTPEEAGIITKDAEEIASYAQPPSGPIEVSKAESSVNKDNSFHFDKETFTKVQNQAYQRFIGEAIQSGNEKNERVEQPIRGQLVQEAIDQLLRLQEELSDQMPTEPCNFPEDDRMHNNNGKNEMRLSEEQMPFQGQTSTVRTKLTFNFIKAMEPQNLPLNAGSGTERANLRHWSMEERKTNKEWKFDYGLQEFITKHAPAEDKTVALLTQAFEAISSDTQQGRKGCFLEKPQPGNVTASTENEANEQQQSVELVHDNPNVYEDAIHTPNNEDDEDLSLVEDSLALRNQAFYREFDTEPYERKVELSGVNLHIHDQGSPKGCPVCYPPESSQQGEEE